MWEKWAGEGGLYRWSLYRQSDFHRRKLCGHMQYSSYFDFHAQRDARPINDFQSAWDGGIVYVESRITPRIAPGALSPISSTWSPILATLRLPSLHHVQSNPASMKVRSNVSPKEKSRSINGGRTHWYSYLLWPLLWQEEEYKTIPPEILCSLRIYHYKDRHQEYTRESHGGDKYISNMVFDSLCRGLTWIPGRTQSQFKARFTLEMRSRGENMTAFGCSVKWEAAMKWIVQFFNILVVRILAQESPNF